jgi:hypothetical protein
MANLATIVNNILADSGINDANVAVITGSNQFNGNQTITGSLTVTGQITAQTLNVQQVTSSIVYSSGSNIFGNSLSDTQQLTGSVSVTGSMNVNGTPVSVGTGSAGQVAFWDGTSSQTGDSGLFWDNTNKRLGIGLNNPAFALDINSPMRVVESLIIKQNPGSTNSVNITHTSGVMILNALNNSFAVRIGNASAFSPGSRRIMPLGQSTFEWGTVWTTGIRAVFGNLEMFNEHVGSHLNFGTENTLRARITNTGNVLINTTTDAGFRLDVNGTARVQGDLTLVVGNVIRFGTGLGLSKTLSKMLIYGGTGAGNVGGTDIHYWNGSTFVAGLRLNNNANVLINTTTDEGFRLDVNGTARIVGATRIDNLAGTGTRMVVADANGVMSTQALGIAGTIAAGQVAFGTADGVIGGDSGFTWDDVNKRLGIGTSAPTARLHVQAQGALSTDIAFRVRNSVDTLDIIRAQGDGSVFVGLGAGNVNTGANNTFIGRDAGRLNTTGAQNTANGAFALQSNTIGTSNTANGYQSLLFNTTGGSNTANGWSALLNNTTGSNNTAIGINAGRFIADGTTALTITNNSVFLGSGTRALANNQTNQIVIGHNAIGLGSNSVVLGNDSITFTGLKGNVGVNTTTNAGFRLDVNGTARVQGVLTTTADAVVNGVSVGIGGGAISSNTRVGVNALNANTTGIQNTAFGRDALLNNTTPNNNSAFGHNTLRSNTTGFQNTAIGSSALQVNNGNNNTATGVQTLQSNTTGFQNTANGFNALNLNTTGISNTATGVDALRNNTTGGNNTANGVNAGRYIADGVTANTISNNSVFLGASTKALADNQSNQIVIGHNAIGLGSNTTVLGNTSTTYGRWYGSLLLGTTTNEASSILTMESTTQGFLPPRMTTTEKNAIASPATGLVVYDNTLNKLSVFTGLVWETITST